MMMTMMMMMITTTKCEDSSEQTSQVDEISYFNYKDWRHNKSVSNLEHYFDLELTVSYY